MEPLLYLVHRIPYPPNKGDKIRSYHLLKYLAGHFDVYLGAFVDDPGDWRYEQQLNEICAEVKLFDLTPRKAKRRSLRGLVTNSALSLPYYSDARLKAWVEETVKGKPVKRSVIYSSTMAQYLIGDPFNELLRIGDFVDVDSDKWWQYSQSHRFPMSWLYRREARRLADFERYVANEFNAVLFVSKDEMDVFTRGLKFGSDGQQKPSAALDYYHNGVDFTYFDPDIELESPYRGKSKVMVFTGAMDYWANVDAVKWFAEQVLPKIHNEEPDARFFIVGANPTQEVKALSAGEGVVVTGSVRDIRPYLRHAHFAIAPLRIARGIQNKVLEAMAMGKQVVATRAAMEGIEACEAYQPLVAEEPQAFAKACVRLLRASSAELQAQGARLCILRHYNWDGNLTRLGKYLGVGSDSTVSQVTG